MKQAIKKILILIIFFAIISFSFYPLDPACADIKGPLERLKSFGDKAGFNTESQNPQDTFITLLGQVITVLLSLLGIIFLVLIIYSGFTWMTAGGDEAKVTKAKTTIQRAVIGLIIIAGSYAIWKLLITPIL
ncbi:MAG: pilin [Planctomycetes bacterium]|jgi:amino acid transporter|nr:pilin [Planctomycetota bacterium]